MIFQVSRVFSVALLLLVGSHAEKVEQNPRCNLKGWWGWKKKNEQIFSFCTVLPFADINFHVSNPMAPYTTAGDRYMIGNLAMYESDCETPSELCSVVQEECIMIDPENARAHCSGAFVGNEPEDTIMLLGTKLMTSEAVYWAIGGGTGAYHGIQGSG